MLNNACFTYQDDKSENLLIRALDRFDLGSTVDDNTFMNLFGEFERWKTLYSDLELNDCILMYFNVNSPMII